MSINIKKSHRGRFTAYKKRTGKTTSQALHSKDPHVRAMANFARMAKRHWKKLADGGNIEEMYAFGGWLQENGLGLLKTGAGIGSMFIPGAQGVGLGLIGSGVSDLIDNNQADEVSNPYTPPVSKPHQIYNLPMAYGGQPKPKVNIDSLFQANKNIPFINKILSGDTTSIQIPGLKGRSTHYMESSDNYMYPTVMPDSTGILKYYGKKAFDNAIKTGNYLEFNTPEEADWAAKNYKNSNAWHAYEKIGKYSYGGNLKSQTQRTNYIGPDHENGGIPLGDTGNEVEGGEARTGNTIHSNRIPITKSIYQYYKDRVPLKKSDIGNTVADVLKGVDKKFEKRSGDKWNDEARRATQIPFEQMSNELADMDNDQMAMGGPLDYSLALPARKDMIPDLNSKDMIINPFLTHPYTFYDPIKEARPWQVSQNALSIPYKKGGKLTKAKSKMILHDGSVRGHKLTDKQRRFFGYMTTHGKGAFGLNLDNTLNFIKDPGNAPIIGSGLGLVNSALQQPETVDYAPAKFTPTSFVPISPETGINNIRRTFGSTRNRLSRLNPRMFQNSLNTLGASEAEAIGNYTQNIQNTNAQMQNQALAIDSGNRTRLSMYNSELARREAEANAANRATKRSTTNAYLNNLFTQVGQQARDTKLMATQKDYQDKMIALNKEYLNILSGGNINPVDVSLDQTTSGEMAYNYPLATYPDMGDTIDLTGNNNDYSWPFTSKKLYSFRSLKPL